MRDEVRIALEEIQSLRTRIEYLEKRLAQNERRRLDQERVDFCFAIAAGQSCDSW
jgi:hypothetical protein